MGVSKESISKFLIGNRFHVKLRILSPYSNRILQVSVLQVSVFKAGTIVSSLVSITFWSDINKAFKWPPWIYMKTFQLSHLIYFDSRQILGMVFASCWDKHHSEM